MKNNKKLLTVMYTLVLVVLAGCGNSSDELSAKSNNQSSNNNSTRSTYDDSSNKDLTEKDTTENSSEGADNTKLNDQEDASDNTSTKSVDREPLKFSNSDSEITESKKEEYLKKLNNMEESDRNSEAGTTMLELEEQEVKRYKKWDVELNEIYGVLTEQLSTEKMDKLREEQRNWIKHRDVVAKEASLKYKGGSTEALEYVATQASLTRERCYELVANYMK